MNACLYFFLFFLARKRGQSGRILQYKTSGQKGIKLMQTVEWKL